jgi:hypothetical protein
MDPVRRTSPPILLPRALIFLAAIWLIGSWLLAIGLMPPVHPSSASFEHGLRMMLLCLGTGLMIAWPLLRLSQVATGAPLRQTILDLLVIASMLQVIIWPLRLVTTWSVARTTAVDATLVGWLVLAGAVVAAATGSDRKGPRNLAMAACLAMCVLGPALASLGVLGSTLSLTLVKLSPLMAVRTLGDGRGAPVTPEQWRWIALLFSAATSAWVALAAFSWNARRTAAQEPPEPTEPAEPTVVTGP